MSHHKPAGPGRAGQCFDTNPRARRAVIPVRSAPQGVAALALLYGVPMPAHKPKLAPSSKRIPPGCPWSQLDLFAAGVAALPSPSHAPRTAAAGEADSPRGGGDAGAAREPYLSLGHLRTREAGDA